jgi:hypothetical protein
MNSTVTNAVLTPRAPILIPTSSLGMNQIASMAVSSDGSKVYLGCRTSSERSRLNLGVLSLNSAGTPAGKPRLYPDSNQGIRFDHNSTVTRILVGPKDARGAGKLYLAVNQEGHPHELPVKLTVYDLDPNGETINGIYADIFADESVVAGDYAA